jgi:hypothetical protein
MTGCRTSAATAAFILAAFAALAQDSNSDRATAPPRRLGDPGASVQPPASPETAEDRSGQPEPDYGESQDSASDLDENSPEVSTDDLLDDVPEDERSHAQTAAPAASAPRDLPPAAEIAPGPALPKPPAVQVAPLGRIDGAPVGLLDSDNGGFQPNMWNGSSREQIEDLLVRVPAVSSDYAIRALARRVILTRSDAPGGIVHRALITLRIEKLLGAGMIDEAGALAAIANLDNDLDFSRTQATALLYANRAKEVCSDLTSPRQTQDDLFWLQLRIYCAAAGGDTSTADLTRGILEARGETDSAFNILLDDALKGAKKPPGKIAKPSAIHVFLMRQAGLSIGNEMAAQLGTPATVLAMRDTRNPPAARLAAADRAVRVGAASLAELKSVADAQDMPASQLGSASETAQRLSFLGGQFLLHLAARSETRPAAKAGLLHTALLLGEKAGLFALASKLQADVAMSVDAAAVPADRRPLIGWSLILAGKTEAAARWIGNASAPHAVLALAMEKDENAQADLSDLARDLNADPKPVNSNQPFEALVLGLYDALGRTIPDDAKSAAETASATRWPGRRPDGDTMKKLMQAVSAADRRGEAVLRILDIIGPKGLGDLAPDVTIELVRALEEMGVRDSARAFALHALLLYRPGTP